ncbi:MAG: ABC transporter ATP-binding protein [Armatimonadetes bacterium]|nr:ABC transporter ATP-binding protein [Armatimonadota bacterium]
MTLGDYPDPAPARQAHTASAPLLKVDRLIAGYGDSVVLHGIALDVLEGEIVSLLGRNGAGKTTTLRSIMGLTSPRAGQVRFRGVEIGGRPPYAIARLGIGYVPDDRRIFPNLTVEENLLLAARMSTGRGRWTLDRVYDLFPALRPLRASRGDHLSGGEQKMLAIGRALMKDPDLVLLDEPAEGLAPLVVRHLIEVLREIRGTRITLLIADQNLNFCRWVADRAYVMEKGMIRASGTMEALWKDEQVIARYLAV